MPVVSLKKHTLTFKLKITIALTFLAWSLGLLIACLVINLYSGLWNFLQVNQEKSNYDYNIIHKEVGLMNTFGLSKSNFKQNEMDLIQQHPAVVSVAPIVSNQFKVGIDGGNMIQFYTELFLQSVPNEFIDLDTRDFKWREGYVVPIIVSNSFIDLYNHGFSVSQGLPQIPKSIITQKQLQLVIKGNGKKVVVPCKIFGFSDRLSTVIVPEEFLLWANQLYGKGKADKYESLIIQSDVSKGVELEQFLNQNGYSYNKEMINLDQTKQIIQSVMLFLLTISTILIVLAVGLSYFVSKTFLYEKSSFIQHLFWLGYSPRFLIQSFFKPIVWIALINSLAVLIAAIVINYFIAQIFVQFNFDIPYFTLAFAIVWLLVSYLSVHIIYLKIKNTILKIV